jgi:hypothetical protein
MGYLSYFFDSLIVTIDNIFYLPNLVLGFLMLPSTALFGLEATATILGLLMSIVTDPLIFPIFLQIAFSFRIMIWFARLVLGLIRLVWSLLPFVG